MKKAEKKLDRAKVLIILLFGLAIGACNNNASDAPPDEPPPEVPDSGIYFDISSVDYSNITVHDSSLDLPAGARVLAAQCAQCHGTYGVAVRDWPDLWGDGRQISNWMTLYQDAETYGDNVMHLHALAYTPDEVDLLKSYYPKVTYIAPSGE